MVINQHWIAPLSFISEFITYLLIKPMFGVFALAIKIYWLFIFGHFSKFLLICDFNFWQISLSWRYVAKDALNQFLVHSSAKNSLKRPKNVVFFLFCVLVDRPMGEAIGPPPPRFPPGCATAVVTVLHFIITHIYFFPSPYSDKHGHELALATVADPENFGGGG